MAVWVLASSRSDKASYTNEIFLARKNEVLPFTSDKSMLKKPWKDFFSILLERPSGLVGDFFQKRPGMPARVLKTFSAFRGFMM